MPPKVSNTRTPSARTIGPVADLERHLPPEWWKELFNSLYLKTDGDVTENDENTLREVDLLAKVAGLESNDLVLDLCCGQGRHSLELASRGYRRVYGLDRSRYLIRLARKRAKQRGLSVRFHEGDARRVRLPVKDFHCVFLIGNSFGYFEKEEDDITVLQSVLKCMAPRGTLAMDLVEGEWMRNNFERRSWEWIDENHLVCRERSLTSDNSRLVTREVIVHSERGVIADQFYAERLYDRERIVDLLLSVGYEAIRFHGDIKTESTREQDLGMMAHRFFLTARAPRRNTVMRPRGKLSTELTVLLGDPRLPDTVKRTGKFNPEDFETVRKLKDALQELDGYKFDYLDNHQSLLRDLRENPPSLVFNLCDEGYDNDAFKELHISAILEMMAIPYTGAGPTCLGVCYNKAIVRSVAQSLDIPVPLETYYDPLDQSATIPSIFPALVKPNFGDSSIGITVDALVHNPRQLVAHVGSLEEELPGTPLLLQEFLPGREYSVGLIGNTSTSIETLPILEVDYSMLDEDLPQILGYESKWLPDSPYWTQIRYREAELEEPFRQELIHWSLLLFERLACRDYARVDWRTDGQGQIKLLEVNPNPGWCWDGKMNFMAGFAGLRYADLLRMLIEAAESRLALSTAGSSSPGTFVPITDDRLPAADNCWNACVVGHDAVSAAACP